MVEYRRISGGQEGFTLVQVMISAALLGVIGLMYAQLSTNAMVAQNSVRQLDDFNNTTALVAMALQNSSVCNWNVSAANVPGNLAVNTFNTTAATLSGQSIAINKLTYPNGTVLLQNGGSPGLNLTVSALKLNRFVELTPGTAYMAMVHVEVTKATGSHVGASLMTKDIPVSLQTTTSGTTATITGCGVAGAPPTTVRTNTVTAWRWAAATVNCQADEIVTGGGGNCNGGAGYNFVHINNPVGNGWAVGCDTPNMQNNTASVYAICMKK